MVKVKVRKKGATPAKKKKAAPPKKDDDRKLVWQEPEESDDTLCHQHVWWDAAHKYCVVRSLNRYGAGHRFAAGFKRVVVRYDRTEYLMLQSINKPLGEGNYPEEYASLEDALKAVEGVYCRRKGVDPAELESNRDEVLAAAKESGLDTLPHDAVTRIEKAVGRAERKSRRKGIDGETQPAKAKGPRGGGGGRYQVFGKYPVTSVIRWMGKEGFSKDQAIKALSAQGVECSPNTVGIQLRAGVKGEGEPAALSQSEAEALSSAKNS